MGPERTLHSFGVRVILLPAYQIFLHDFKWMASVTFFFLSRIVRHPAFNTVYGSVPTVQFRRAFHGNSGARDKSPTTVNTNT